MSTTKASFINSVTEAMRNLHAQDQHLNTVLKRVQTSRVVTAEDFEAILEAQRMSLRTPANILLMFTMVVEEQPWPTAPRGLRSRLREMLR